MLQEFMQHKLSFSVYVTDGAAYSILFARVLAVCVCMLMHIILLLPREKLPVEVMTMDVNIHIEVRSHVH